MPCSGELRFRTNADQQGFIFGKMLYPCSVSQALMLPIHGPFSALASCSVKRRGSKSNAYMSRIQKYVLSAQKARGFSDLYLSRVCFKTNIYQALLQTEGISILRENSISHNAEALASSVMNNSTLGKWCGLGIFFSGILCRQLRISPYQPGAVCQTTPHHTRKCMLN